MAPVNETITSAVNNLLLCRALANNRFDTQDFKPFLLSRTVMTENFTLRGSHSSQISQLQVVLHLCGFLVLLYSFSMLPPMAIALVNKERSYMAFLSTFVTFLPSAAARLMTRHAGIQLRTRDGFVIIVLFWFLFSIISAMPLWMDDVQALSLADALFEGVSGSPPPARR